MTRCRRSVLYLGSLFVLSFVLHTLHRDRILKFCIKNQKKQNKTKKQQQKKKKKKTLVWFPSDVVPEFCPFLTDTIDSSQQGISKRV